MKIVLSIFKSRDLFGSHEAHAASTSKTNATPGPAWSQATMQEWTMSPCLLQLCRGRLLCHSMPSSITECFDPHLALGTHLSANARPWFISSPPRPGVLYKPCGAVLCLCVWNRGISCMQESASRQGPAGICAWQQYGTSCIGVGRGANAPISSKLCRSVSKRVYGVVNETPKREAQ